MTLANLPHDACRSDPQFQALKEDVIARTGMAFYRDREDSLSFAVTRRMSTLKLGDCASYRRLLVGPGGTCEWNSLIDEVTIGETYFFRFPAQFDALRDHVIPDIVARRGDRRQLRIWSAGCASGAEPYSIAIMLQLDLPHLLADWDISIIGTDISHGKLARADAGVFSEWELRQIPDRYRQACFDRVGDEWRLRDAFKRHTSFEIHNLVEEVPNCPIQAAGDFDLILCRNVMIYFDGDVIRQVTRALYGRLQDGGWLIVGHAEPHLAISNLFDPYPVAETTLYRKLADRPQAPSQHRPGIDTPTPAIRAAALRPPNPALHGRSHAPETAGVRRSGTTTGAGPATPAEPAAVVAGGDRGDPTLKEARRLANAGEWLAAATQCKRCLDTEPLDADAHYLLALVLGHQGDTAGAEASLRSAVYIDRNFALAHYQIGRLAANRGDVGTARRALRNVHNIVQASTDTDVVRAGEGLTAGELLGLVRLHSEQLERSA